MADLYLTNSLTRKKEKFVPIKAGHVGIYSCGPTVYWNQHIGHMFAYVHWDAMVRSFKYLGFEVEWVMNITDVGHMTSDEDEGEDKMEKGAKREGLTVWQIAEKYIAQFEDSLNLLNIHPDKMARVTDHINEQIEMIKTMENAGFTYKTKTGVVFDTSKFPEYAKFANLDLKNLRSGSRVEVDDEKKKPWDFLLWVTNKPNHAMQWESPWGKGYPGWHIECTAISTKYLGKKFDIHTGGKEHIPVHHTNEIAQGYGVFGDQTANYWLHNEWLNLKGEKMSKSLGNIYTIKDLIKKGYEPMHFRYLVLTSHYKKGLNFTLEALEAARTGLNNLRQLVTAAKNQTDRTALSEEKRQKTENFNTKFKEAISDDLNMSKALAVCWQALKSNIPSEDKYDLAISFDEVLGLGLKNAKVIVEEIPEEIVELAKERDQLRKEGDFESADKIRKDLEKKGFQLVDTGKNVKLTKVSN